MTKELNALKRLKNNLQWLQENTSFKYYFEDNELHFKEDLDIIESTSEDYDAIKDICTSYNIEFNLTNIREALFTLAQLRGEYDTNWSNYNKKLKALEIIKEKGVDILKLKECKRCKKPDEYNKRTSYSYHKMLTQEEFDLLKEVLL